MPKIKYKEISFKQNSLVVIQQANAIIDEYAAQGFDLTLRQLFYQCVARALLENTVQNYKRLGGIINDARLAGLIDWERIEDRTRGIERLASWDSPQDVVEACASQFRIDLWKEQEWRPEVWIEKEALAGVFERICNELRVPYLSCRGYTSQSEMWRAAMRLREHTTNGQKPIILHFGDHDPSGIDMSRDIEDRLAVFGADIEFVRLALNMAQVEQYNPPPNPAKALAIDTPLPTPGGWTTIGEVAVGDRVFGANGRPCRVVGKSVTFHAKPCYEFTFAGGCTIVCSGDHLWNLRGRKRARRVRTADAISRSWREGKDGRLVYRAPVAASLVLPELALPIHPYVLGVWLGAGGIGEGKLFNDVSDDEILANVRAAGYAAKRHAKCRCQIYGLRKHIHALGMACDKFIPAAYLRASEAQRLELLCGLMDTDGTVGDPDYRTARPCSFSNKRLRLIDDFEHLLCTLGIKPRRSEGDAVCDGRYLGPHWRVEFYPGERRVFGLARKQKRLGGAVRTERQNWRVLVNVRRVRPRPTRCIVVDAKDHLFLAGKHMIPTHNSTDSRFTAYMAAFGGESWELDALDPTVLAALVRERVERLRDQAKWQESVAEEEEHKRLLGEVADNWDDVTQDL